MAGSAVPIAAAFALPSGVADASTPSFTRPTGPGIYAYEDLGVKGLNLVAGMTAAMSAAARDHRSTATLTLPAGTFIGSGFGQSANNATFLVPQNLSLVGSGPGTIIQAAPNSITTSQYDSVPTGPRGATNPLQLMIVPKGTGTTLAQFTLQGTPQKGQYYNGLNMYKCAAPIVTDVKIAGIPGWLNSPPGETFAMDLNSGSGAVLTRVEIDGRDQTGKKVGGTGIGVNNASNVQMHSVYAHHMGFSAGVSFWQSTGITTYSLRCEYNGLSQAAGGTGGSNSPNLNHELTRNTIHYSPILGYCSMSDVRYYAHPKSSDPYSGDTTGHTINGATMSDGRAFTIHLDNAQYTKPVLINCPPPTYLSYR